MSARDGMTIARPLFAPEEARPIAFADARGATFVDDPSNADPRFARTRLRSLLARLGEEGLDTDALDRLARRAGETEAALAYLTAEVEARIGSKALSRRARCSRRRSRSRSGFWRGASPSGRSRCEPRRARKDRNASGRSSRRSEGAAGAWRQCRRRRVRLTPRAGSVSSPSRRGRAAYARPLAAALLREDRDGGSSSLS